MASFYSDEDFSGPVVEFLHKKGHDVLTAFDAGNANKKEPDESILYYAVTHERIVLTHNRKHFRRLHAKNSDHFGIVICTRDEDWAALAARIDEAVSKSGNTAGQLIRVIRTNPSEKTKKQQGEE